MPTTYSAQGDQWAIGNPSSQKDKEDATADGQGSTFHELTKDLVGVHSNSVDIESMSMENPMHDGLDLELNDFDMSDDDNKSVGGEDERLELEETETKKGRRKKKKDPSSDAALALETQPPEDNNSTRDETGDESVDMKEEGDETNNDEDDKTVALSKDGRESDEDKTVAFSDGDDEDDDRTIALSLAGVQKDDPERNNEQPVEEEIRNTTIAIPVTNNDRHNDNDDDNDDLSENLFDTHREQKAKEPNARDDATSSEKANVDSDSDNGEMEFGEDDDDIATPAETEMDHKQSFSANTSKSDEDSHIDTPSKDAAARTPRRSVRGRKARVIYEPVLASMSAKKPKKKKNSPSKKSSPPSEEEWIAATDVMFVDTDDKSSVTIKQIFTALEEKFQSKITKPLKKILRNRLRELVTGDVVASCTTAVSDNKEEPEEGDQGTKSESDNDENNDDDDDDSEGDADDEGSVYSEDEEHPKEKTRRKPTMALSSATKKKTRKEGRPKRKASTTRAALKVMEAHRLRQKKRADELKVRNEEMQLDQTKEDEERQEAIAKKFETNTDELRLKRLEDRLDLLQRLDETRISVVADTDKNESKETNPKEDSSCKTVKTEDSSSDGLAVETTEGKAKAKTSFSENNSSSSESEEESSSDEEDLVIIGMNKPFKPLKPLHNHLPSRGLQLLNEIRSPKHKKTGRPKPMRNTNPKDAASMILSPNRSMGARFAMRNALKQKQRKQGNRWLARELGYKTEEDHLKDCQTVADRKRGLVVKQEQERLKTNERKQLRERLILQEQQGFVDDNNNNEDEDPEDEAYVPPDETEEEDEEMKMAKEIEQEARDRDLGQTNEGGTAKTEISHQGLEENDDANEKGMETQPLMSGGNIGSGGGEDSIENTMSRKLTTPEKMIEEIAASSVDANKEMVLPTEEESSTLNSNTESDTGNNEGAKFTDINPISAPDESIVTPEKNDTNSEDEGELEFDGTDSTNEEEPLNDPNQPRNAGWKAMLERETERLKKRKKRKGGLVEEEAEEEEEEEIAGLEDFGFSISKKNKSNDDEENVDDQLDDEDLKHVVDDVSDGEGDEDAGRVARKRLEQQEEKARHKEILRRMREGYDGRRGGIAGGGAGARGMHRFDQLVAADNREDAKRLGLLNDDELDSEDEDGKAKRDDIDEEDDEAALLDKMLKDRFLHRSSVDQEENFSEDEEEEEDETAKGMPNPKIIAILLHGGIFISHKFYLVHFQKTRVNPMTKK